MSLTEAKCKEKGGKIYDLEDTKRQICVLPHEKEKAKKAVLID